MLVPLAALVVTAWAGLSGPRPDGTAELPAPTSAAVQHSQSPEAQQPQYPPRVLGLEVHRLEDVRLALLTRDDVVAIAGLYVPLAITDCPPGVVDDQGAAPSVRPGFDPWAYCERSGVLYASNANLRGGPGDGLSSVAASLVTGVVLPSTLEVVGADPTPVVVLGRFVETSTACMLLGACPSELIVDYLAWPPVG